VCACMPLLTVEAATLEALRVARFCFIAVLGVSLKIPNPAGSAGHFTHRTRAYSPIWGRAFVIEAPSVERDHPFKFSRTTTNIHFRLED
jgi:hypothetical protein